MNYKLAKLLRDEGFPFSAAEHFFFEDFIGLQPVIHPEEIGFPTLSELIEACGNHAGFRIEWKAIHKGWRASAFNNN